MREIRPSGSEGGGALSGSPYPYPSRRVSENQYGSPGLVQRLARRLSHCNC
jgi:hypothetical protein